MSLLRIYLRVLGLLAAEKWLAIGLSAANVALAAVFLIEPWLFGRVVDALAAKAASDAWSYILWWTGVGFFGVAASVLVALHADRLAHRRKLAAIVEFFEHALALPLAFHDRHHTGRLMRTLHSGSSNLFHVWLVFFRSHLSTLIAVLVMVPFALRTNWKLGVLMLLLMSSFVLFNTLVSRRTGTAQRTVEKLNQHISERTGDVFGNVMVVQSFSRVVSEVGALRELAGKVLAAQYPVLRGWAWAAVANRAASTLTVIGLFALGVHLHAQGEISVGAIVSFVGFAMMMIGRMEQLAGFISELFFQAPALANFFEILDTRSGLEEEPGAPALAAVRGEVAFENVWFGYDDAQPVLRDLSFRVPGGSTVAVVGPTGAGKTTALSLLYRAYDPTRGCIRIDGVDIRTVSLASLRAQIAVVFQNPGLLYRSIAENLRIGKPDASDAEVEAAAMAAEAHHFVSDRPERYGALVAEQGKSLSGGERQRLSIARAMLKNAPVLILDEATSALDNLTEARVQRALAALVKGRTTFIIAHRLSTVRSADLILVLKDGQLVERGRYEELVRLGGVFAELDARGRFVPDAPPAADDTGFAAARYG
ncbi:MAG: glucan ABC transporter ATP-binding protein/ permease [Gammaproteobacteria bacterium]|nr:glucan ABC transporter ATP-binding protein/ permease [Gammaproteobacteria bacterium]MBV9724788.1 glucan ABC transporter ATP-binding protein/ permease [Gammaproteobacteria bacterium]